MKQNALFVLTFLLAGCSSLVIVDETKSDNPLQAWQRVLTKHVDDNGRVRFDALSRDRSDLDAYVYYISKHSPDSSPQEFPDKASKLAYYLNAYNALAMYNVLNLGMPANNNSFLKRFRFFYLVKFPIGGNDISLYGLENDYIRAMGDSRVHFAINSMAKSGPRLPKEPFTAERLDAQLQAATISFYNEPRNVEILAEAKEVHVSELVDFFTDDFLHDSPSIIAHINQYRPAGNKIPDDYDVEFMDYDWTIIEAQP